MTVRFPVTNLIEVLICVLQVEQAKAGMDVLAASQATIGELRDAFMMIDK